MARTRKPGARDAGLQGTFASSKSAATQSPKVNRSRQQDHAERPIASIRVGKRYRHDLGDIDGLAASMAALGLLHPIVVTPDGLLICGERRLCAAKLLGWKQIPVTVRSKP